MELLYAFLSILLGIIILIISISNVNTNVNTNKITKTKSFNTHSTQVSITKCYCGNHVKCISKIGICDYLKYPDSLDN